MLPDEAKKIRIIHYFFHLNNSKWINPLRLANKKKAPSFKMSALSWSFETRLSRI
jgi:hypothetical protein